MWYPLSQKDCCFCISTCFGQSTTWSQQRCISLCPGFYSSVYSSQFKGVMWATWPQSTIHPPHPLQVLSLWDQSYSFLFPCRYKFGHKLYLITLKECYHHISEQTVPDWWAHTTATTPQSDGKRLDWQFCSQTLAFSSSVVQTHHRLK